MKPLFAAALAIGLASAAVAQAQGRPSTDGVARAGSNAGSSAVTQTGGAASRSSNAKASKSAAKHRLPSNVTGMGSQAANTTGATSNSH